MEGYLEHDDEEMDSAMEGAFLEGYLEQGHLEERRESWRRAIWRSVTDVSAQVNLGLHCVTDV